MPAFWAMSSNCGTESCGDRDLGGAICANIIAVRRSSIHNVNQVRITREIVDYTGRQFLHRIRGRELGAFEHDRYSERQSATHRADVQHGLDSNDLFWVYVLSVERTEQLSYFAEGRATESSDICE